MINKWGISSRTYIENMLNMAHINYIGVDVVNDIQINKNGRDKRDQTSKYTILNNEEYYLHHDW